MARTMLCIGKYYPLDNTTSYPILNSSLGVWKRAKRVYYNPLTHVFNPISIIIDHQEKQRKNFQKDSLRLERENKQKCNQNIAECNQFVTLSVDEPLRLIKANKLCFNCLSNSHIINS